jgi:hypothetical protein
MMINVFFVGFFVMRQRSCCFLCISWSSFMANMLLDRREEKKIKEKKRKGRGSFLMSCICFSAPVHLAKASYFVVYIKHDIRGT